MIPDLPLAQIRPRFTGESGLPMTFTTFPSFTLTRTPHPTRHIRQVVGTQSLTGDSCLLPPGRLTVCGRVSRPRRLVIMPCPFFPTLSCGYNHSRKRTIEKRAWKGEAARRTAQWRVWCLPRWLPFSQAFTPETQFAEPARSPVEGPLQDTGSLPRTGGLACQSTQCRRFSSTAKNAG